MNMLTKLEELILLSVIKLADDAYGKSIFQLIRSITGKNLSLGGNREPEKLPRSGVVSVNVIIISPVREWQHWRKLSGSMIRCGSHFLKFNLR